MRKIVLVLTLLSAFGAVSSVHAQTACNDGSYSSSSGSGTCSHHHGERK